MSVVDSYARAVVDRSVGDASGTAYVCEGD